MQDNESAHRHDQYSYYFEDPRLEDTEIEQKIEALEAKRKAFQYLDNVVKEIDCNIGCGTLSIDNNIIKVEIQVPDPSHDSVQHLLHEFNWEKEFEAGYNQECKLCTFTLEARLHEFMRSF